MAFARSQTPQSGSGAAATERHRRRIAGMMAAVCLPLGASQTVTLEWDRSPDPAVIGYKLYWRELGATNALSLDAGFNTVCAVSNLIETLTYRFHVTAYNGANLESDPSESLDYTIPLGQIESRLGWDDSGNALIEFRVPVPEGRRVALQISTNLEDWSTVALSDFGQALHYRTTNVALTSKAFFRSVSLPSEGVP